MMRSREKMLEAIKANKPLHAALPDLSLPTKDENNLAERYKESLTKNGGKLFSLNSVTGVNDIIRGHFPESKQICSLVEGISSNRTISAQDYPLALHDIDLAIVQGTVGVAENAATWLSEENLVIRALPFITQHLIIVLKEDDIVATMHDAYQRINLQETTYGVFIAGPSKTADIEQSLVIGAHGARSLTVILIESL